MKVTSQLAAFLSYSSIEQLYIVPVGVNQTIVSPGYYMEMTLYDV